MCYNPVNFCFVVGVHVKHRIIISLLLSLFFTTSAFSSSLVPPECPDVSDLTSAIIVEAEPSEKFEQFYDDRDGALDVYEVAGKLNLRREWEIGFEVLARNENEAIQNAQKKISQIDGFFNFVRLSEERTVYIPPLKANVKACLYTQGIVAYTKI